MPNEKKLFCRKTLAFAYSDMLKSPLAARGDFISLSRECKFFFRTKAKKRRAPKCPPLWSLAFDVLRDFWEFANQGV